jgi:hypothetical protein
MGYIVHMESSTALARHFTPDEIEDSDFRAVAIPSNTLLLPDNVTRGEAIEHMARTIPTNEYGLPLYYLRSDMLDLNLICHRGYTSQDEVDSSAEILSYQDGYPTFRSGSPFWTCMPHEPHSAFILFQAYLALDELEGIRLLDSLATQQVVELHKKREVRIRKTENSHFNLAGGVIDSIVNRINNEPKLIEEMPADKLFDLLEQMAKLQRLSLGLTGAQSSSTNTELRTPGASVEVLIRQLTKNVGLTEQRADGFQARLATLMSDENTAMQMQELVIRATGLNGG